MTQRQFLEAIAQGTMNEEIQTKAQAMLDGLAASNDKRAAKVAEKSAETYAPFIAKFAACLTDKPQTATDLLKNFEDEVAPSGKPVSVQFLSSVGAKVVAAGLATKVDVTIKGKGSQKGYVAATLPTDAE